MKAWDRKPLPKSIANLGKGISQSDPFAIPQPTSCAKCD
jgi:hypothetical protein